MEDQQAQRHAREASEEVNEENISILHIVLEPRSLARLRNIKIVDAEKYSRVETLLANCFKSGRIAAKLADEDFVKILSSLDLPKKSEVIYSRRASDLDF